VQESGQGLWSGCEAAGPRPAEPGAVGTPQPPGSGCPEWGRGTPWRRLAARGRVPARPPWEARGCSRAAARHLTANQTMRVFFVTFSIVSGNAPPPPPASSGNGPAPEVSPPRPPDPSSRGGAGALLPPLVPKLGHDCVEPSPADPTEQPRGQAPDPGVTRGATPGLVPLPRLGVRVPLLSLR